MFKEAAWERADADFFGNAVAVVFVVAEHHRDRDVHWHDATEVLEGADRALAGIPGDDHEVDARQYRDGLDRMHVAMEVGEDLDLHSSFSRSRSWKAVSSTAAALLNSRGFSEHSQP